jgi:hypothetical protein
MLFNHSKYYRVNERIAKSYLQKILIAVSQVHSKMIIHKNINMKSIHIGTGS